MTPIKETQTKELQVTFTKENDKEHQGLENIDFQALVRENSKRLFKVAYHLLGNFEESEEVVQEVFLEAYKSLPTFKGKSKLSTWLYSIAMNILSEFVRRKKNMLMKMSDLSLDELEKCGVLGINLEDVESEYLKKLRYKNIKNAVIKLPVRYRIVFILNVVEGYSHKEIAEILKISPGAVRVIRVRAAKMIRKELEKLESDFYQNQK